MERQKVLITGSSGKIGNILMNYLKDEYELFGIDRRISNTEKNVFKIDISNYDQISNIFQKLYPIHYVIHLAADPRVDADWQSVLTNNIVGTKNVYEMANGYKVQRVIFASSVHATGKNIEKLLSLPDNQRKIIKTKDEILTDSDYGASKVYGEVVARQYFEVYGIESICLRLGAVLHDNNPGKIDRLRKEWLSHRDLVQLIRKSLLSEIRFGIYFGISNNKGRYLDISNAIKDLGFDPKDDSSLL